MEEDNERAYIQKYRLQEGLSEGLLNAMGSRAAFWDAYANAQTVRKVTKTNDEEIATLKKQLRTCAKPELRKELRKKLTAAEEGNQTIVDEQKVIDGDMYRMFMQDFNELWTAFKSQITRWVRAKTLVENEKIVELGTKDHIDWLFEEATEGRMHPKEALYLYDEFLECLKLSGLYDLSVKEVETE